MRIIAGSARRTVLEVAAGSETRPFLEMARGALFNALGNRIEQAVALDLYAGSGALGLEALSRGAAGCVFVERDPAACRALRNNIVKCGMAARARVMNGDVCRALAAIRRNFDLIFLDPPFPELPEWREAGAAEETMRLASRVLTADGTLIFRLEDGKIDPPEWPGLELESDRRYGRSRICRYGRSDSGK